MMNRSGLLRICTRLSTLVVAALLPVLAAAEGSRTLYPATYSPAGSRANLDLQGGSGRYAGVVKRETFLYVYARAGEYILTASFNRSSNSGGDVLIYNPQSFGTPGDETVPATAQFTCSAGSAQPGTHYFGATRGIIASRAEELAGANSADGSATVSGAYAPCGYQAPVTGIYGVRFTVATSNSIGITASIANPGINNQTVSAWDVTVRATAASIADLNGRLFTYAWVAFTGGNARPLYSALDYITIDGYRYKQTLRGLDPNGFALYANVSGFLDNGEPLYRDIRGNEALVTTLPTGVTSQNAQYPIFFSDTTPGGANEPEVARVLAALGIRVVPLPPIVSGVTFEGNVSGSTSTVGAGGTFKFNSLNTLTYQIVISRNGIDFDPANPLNRVLTGVAFAGSHAVNWDGRDNAGAPFPVGSGYTYRLTGRNGEIHFPIIDAEGNVNGGPTVTKLNGSGGTTVYFDDRGYVTRNGTAVGTPNGLLCPASPPVPPTPNQALAGIDSNNTTLFNPNYYRAWPGNGNSNTDCAGSAGFGDAKGLNLWTHESTTDVTDTLNIVPAGFAVDVGTAVTVSPSAFPGQTVYGTLVFRNDGTAQADGVAYSLTVGSPGNRPASVAFPALPPGGSFAYNSATGIVTFSGFPASLSSGQQISLPFNYPAPAPGDVPVVATISATNESSGAPSANVATASTRIVIADAQATVAVPASAAAGSTVNGTITFANGASATATAGGLVYSAAIGNSTLRPASVSFPTLPPGVGAAYDSSTGTLTFTGMPVALDPGQTLTFGFTYTAPASGTIPVTASIASTTPESTNANNNASGSTSFSAPSADLAITKSNGTSGVVAGGTTTYAIVVTNGGPSAAGGAVVTDAPATGLAKTGVSCVAAGGATCPASVNVAQLEAGVAIPTLPGGGAVTFSVTAGVTAGSGSVTNTATVAPPSGVTDPTPGNNSASDTDPVTTVNPAPPAQVPTLSGWSLLLLVLLISAGAIRMRGHRR